MLRNKARGVSEGSHCYQVAAEEIQGVSKQPQDTGAGGTARAKTLEAGAKVSCLRTRENSVDGVQWASGS